MTIILLHKHYDADHLADITKQMRSMGAPQIKAIWDKANDIWRALEGCHRIRAARDLGLIPEIIDVGSYDEDGYIDRDALDGVTVNSLTDDDNLIDDPEREVLSVIDDPNAVFNNVYVDFEEDEEDC